MGNERLDWLDILDSDEQDKLDSLLASAPIRDRLLIQTIQQTGARGVEVVGDLKKGLHGIRQKDLRRDSIFVQGAKKSRDRFVDVPIALIKDLQSYCKTARVGIEERLFPITTRQLRRIWDYYRPNREVIAIRKRQDGSTVEVRKGVHKLRHTYLTLLYANCPNVKLLQEQSGHVEVSNLDRYVHFVGDKKAKRQAIKGMWKIKLKPEEKE